MNRSCIPLIFVFTLSLSALTNCGKKDSNKKNPPATQPAPTNLKPTDTDKVAPQNKDPKTNIPQDDKAAETTPAVTGTEVLTMSSPWVVRQYPANVSLAIVDFTQQKSIKFNVYNQSTLTDAPDLSSEIAVFKEAGESHNVDGTSIPADIYEIQKDAKQATYGLLWSREYMVNFKMIFHLLKDNKGKPTGTCRALISWGKPGDLDSNRDFVHFGNFPCPLSQQ